MKKIIKSLKYILFVILAIIILIGFYWIIVYGFQNLYDGGSLQKNEFGDYIGGILNPLFTLISTAAIIYLTYIIAMNEDKKAEKAIDTQKRITLGQMRQESLNRLADKLNLYIYDIDKMTIVSSDANKFIRTYLKNRKEEEGHEKIIVWAVIASELESFLHQEFLFKQLFQDKEFDATYQKLLEIALELMADEKAELITEQESLENFIAFKQEVITRIGTYIYSEF